MQQEGERRVLHGPAYISDNLLILYCLIYAATLKVSSSNI